MGTASAGAGALRPMGKTMLTGLVYISAADPMLVEDDIRDILKVAQTRNRDDGVTGLLIYSGTSFVQILEGQRQTLQELMTSIRGDRRHYDVSLLEHRPIDDRAFDKWSMAYREIDADLIGSLLGDIGWDQKRPAPKVANGHARGIIENLRGLAADINAGVPDVSLAGRRGA